MEKYDQNITNWIKPTDQDYDQQLISPATQEKYLIEFYNHYYATDADALSPWSSNYVALELEKLKGHISEKVLTDKYGNSPVTKYDHHNRGIAIKNLSARTLPTIEPHFYHYYKTTPF